MSRSSCSWNGRSGLAATYSFSFVAGSDENFRPDEAGRFGGVRGGVLVAAQHPLVAAVGHVLGRFQIGVRAEPLAGAIEFAVELEDTWRARPGRSPSVPRNFSYCGICFSHFGERRFPVVVAREQAGEVPGVGRL